MKRILFYLLSFCALGCRLVYPKWYMKLIVKAHKAAGVKFDGMPEYIDYNAHLDPSGGLAIGEGVVISTRVIILTHDWSFLKKMKARNEEYKESMSNKAFSRVEIGADSFIGAGSIILPGSVIGKYCIIGAGSVVKGVVEDYSVMAGVPARKIKDVR